MKINDLPTILGLILMFCSCDSNEIKYVLDDAIQAGQKIGNGIEYKDLNPDINCTIINAWVKTDTIINLDLNNDGENDFSIKKTMCSPSQLGGDCEDVTIIPLKDNEVCINSQSKWLDTLSFNGIINANNNWTNKESLVYSYFWVLGGETSTKGYWQKAREINKNYVGIKIKKADKEFFGWIGMYSDSTHRSFDFYLTDYALLKEYSKE